MSKRSWALLFIALILAVFISSIILRYDNIFLRPLSVHNEDATAHVLITINALNEVPLLQHKFLPIVTLSESYDKNIDDFFTASVGSGDGNYFYTSFPPFGFLAPYLFFKVFSLEDNVVNIRLFGLIVEAVTILLLFWLLLKFLPDFNNSFPEKCLFGFLGVIVYLFNAESLWSHCNAYWGQSLLQPLWLASLLVALYLLQKKDFSLKMVLLFSVLIFLLDYTEWTGYIVTMSLAVLFLYAYHKTAEKGYLKFSILAVVLGAFTFLFMVFQFSLVTSVPDYFSRLIYRASKRVGLLSQLQSLIQNYWLAFGLFIIVLLSMALLLLALWWSGRIKKGFLIDYKLVFIGLTYVPMVENFVFLNHATGYTYDVLKLSVPLILTLVYLAYVIYSSVTKKTLFLGVFAMCLLISAIFSINTYYELNNSIPLNSVVHQNYEQVGSYIQDTAGNGTTATINVQVRGHLIYYADRNIIEKVYSKDAFDSLVKNGTCQDVKYYICGYDFYVPDHGPVFSPWLFYGEIAGVVEYNTALPDRYNITIIPAHYTYADWEDGVFRYPDVSKMILVQNRSILEFLKPGSYIYGDHGSKFKIEDIDYLQSRIIFSSDSNFTELAGSKSFHSTYEVAG